MKATPPETSAQSARSNDRAGPVIYVNGLWYTHTDDGVRFRSGERFANKGLFVERKPADAVTVDLQGAFVVPPFGEAHNHSVDGAATVAAAQKYISQGIFYYKNPNSIYAIAEPQLDYWRQPDTLDISFSFGGLSVDEGHPEVLYRTLLGYGLYSSIDAEQLDGNAFYDVSTPELLDEKWDAIVANRPDFLKLYLLDHTAEQSDGLSEPMFRQIVTRAKAAGLRTTVHVETAGDLALAVDAGADEAAHLPAYNLTIAKDVERSRIADAAIARMAERQFVVVATTHVSQGRDYDAAGLKVVMDRQADNLARLHAAGVPIAIGSDSFFQTAKDEVQTLRKLAVFDDATLLSLWVQTPALSIYPNRAIGVLEPGYEASFLALGCDPLADFDCVEDIDLGIKQGETLIDNRQ